MCQTPSEYWIADDGITLRQVSRRGEIGPIICGHCFLSLLSSYPLLHYLCRTMNFGRDKISLTAACFLLQEAHLGCLTWRMKLFTLAATFFCSGRWHLNLLTGSNFWILRLVHGLKLLSARNLAQNVSERLYHIWTNWPNVSMTCTLYWCL